MYINLRQQLRRAGYKGSSLVLTAIVTTSSQEKDLARIYMPVVRMWATAARERILPEYSRSLEQAIRFEGLGGLDSAIIALDTAEDLNAEIQATDQGIVRYLSTFRAQFEMWMSAIQSWHVKKFASQIVSRSNVDLSTQMGADDVAETMSDILERNTALIRNVSDEVRGKISDIVFRGLQNRTPVKEVAREISRATGLARDRALRIASDQIVKLSSALDKQRQLQVGMGGFNWKHSRKLHFRPIHKARDGKFFAWDSEVAQIDPPGFAPFCGCKAQGVLTMDEEE